MISQDDSAALQTLIEADGGDLMLKEQTFRIGAPIDLSRVPRGRRIRFLRSRLIAVDDRAACILDFSRVNRPGGSAVAVSVVDCALEPNGRPAVYGT